MSSDTDDWGYTALIYAMDMPDTRVAKALISQGVDVNAECRPAWRSALYYVPTTPLVRAASCGNTDAVSLLLDNGANIDQCIQSGNNPLTAAVSRNHVDVVQQLIDKGADIHKPNGYSRDAVGTLDLCMKNRRDGVTQGSPEEYNAVKGVIESKMGFVEKSARRPQSLVGGGVCRGGGPS